MDLETPARPLVEYADPGTIAGIVFVLALLPFLLALVASLWLRPRTDGRPPLHGGVASRGILRHVPRTFVAVVAVLPLAILVVTDLNLLSELLLLDFGWAVALVAVALGALAGTALTQRLRHRPTAIAAASVAALAVVVSILFAGQFEEHVPGDAPSATATEQPGTGQPTATDPAGQPTAEPTMAPVQDNPSLLATPMGDFATQPICLEGYGTEAQDAVAVTVTGVFTIEARLPDGAVVQVGTARELFPCGRRDGAAPEEVYAPGKAFEQFDGSLFRIEGERGMRVIARVTGAEGGEYLWVWRGADGVTYHGIIAAEDLQR